ncbi:inhibitor of growth protein 3 [Podospora fimiseda]|uniref:Inhibitor of growth protein 3 n=1 Tax=Podospora fimiseda TaxID=252190 RepID=A0AAN7GPU5_9PEZI|nr:inhibitor of growth protein 3 [Podospora fimiseda]
MGGGAPMRQKKSIKSEQSIDLRGPMEVDGSVKSMASVTLNGDISVRDRIEAYGDLSLSGNLNCSGKIKSMGNVKISGSAVCADKVKIFGKLKINGTLEVAGDLEVWGALTINGYLKCRTLTAYASLTTVGDQSWYETEHGEKIHGAKLVQRSNYPLRPDAEAADISEEAISPRNPVPSTSIEQAIQSIINPLDLRADPDAQATVSDFLDFTEYLPADIMRSLTQIGQLDQTYIDASAKVHDLTKLWGQLPTLSPGERPCGPVELRAQISETMQYAMNSRIYSQAEAQRMTENVNRHYNRAKTILAKLQTMFENYPPPEEQKSPVAAKSPQMSRAPKITLRVDGEKTRRPRVPRITVPGEVLAPYELNYDAYTTGSDSSSEEEDDDEVSSSRVTPAPHARIKVVRAAGSRPPKSGGRSGRARASVPPSGAPVQLSTSQQLAQLAPPPENAVPGSADAPWCQLTPFELARLRKRMKKNAAWTPSDTMVARELSALGRGVEAFKKAKAKAEEEGIVFEGQMPVPSIDPETGEKRLPPGALTSEALTSDDKAISNRGMKLNEAKKLKREMLAKMAAEEAEQSAKSFEMMARAIMSDAAPPIVQDQPSRTTSRSKAAKKRKRDSVPEGDAEKPEAANTQAQRPQFKRTKTETPVPPPLLTSGSSLAVPPQETAVQPQRAAGGSTVLHSTTPIPLPVHALDQCITAKAGSVTSATSPAGSIAGPSNTSTIAPLKLPTSETPIPLPIISPTKKSATPILPPVRETRKAPPRAANQDSQQQQQQQKDNQTLHPPKTLTSRTASPELTSPKPDPDAQAAAAPPLAQQTTTTTTITRRPASRGKATSQEPSGPPPAPAITSLAADRPRRTKDNNIASSIVANPLPSSSSSSSAAAGKPAQHHHHHSKRTGKRPAPGVISRTNSGGNSAVGTRKAAPRKKAAASSTRSSTKKEEANNLLGEVEVDDEGNVIDDDEPRYCRCNRVSFGTMIQCDNVDVSKSLVIVESSFSPSKLKIQHCEKEWFHLECVGLEDIPARTTKWFCPDCRKKLGLGERGEVTARGVRA